MRQAGNAKNTSLLRESKHLGLLCPSFFPHLGKPCKASNSVCMGMRQRALLLATTEDLRQMPALGDFPTGPVQANHRLRLVEMPATQDKTLCMLWGLWGASGGSRSSTN